jgi:hypothetical protein
MIAFGCSCSTSKSDPLAGFHWCSLGELDANKVITADYKEYIRTLTSEEKKYLGGTDFFKDETGQHVVRIEIDLNGTAWYHTLFYDKDNKRIKVIKYVGWHYMS